MEEKILINILTRTSGRPNYFKENRKSVKDQTYTNIRHIIHTDNPSDVECIRLTGVQDNDIFVSEQLELKEKTKQIEKSGKTISVRHRPYNLYLNKLNNKVHQGWIMYLDDDDIIYKARSIEKLAEYIKNCSTNDLVVFKGSFVNKSKFIFNRYTLPKKNTVMEMQKGVSPAFGQIGGICFAFHHTKKGIALWDEFSGSDHRVFVSLLQDSKVKYFPEIITSVYNGPNGGRYVDLIS